MCSIEKLAAHKGTSNNSRSAILAPKRSQLCVANLRNSQLLRAIRALIRAFLITNLICPELLEVPIS